MDIPNNYLICDIRCPKDFNNGTISGYKKRDVINAFENSIINNKIEEALYWCVELHISTYDKDIWKSIYDIYKKYIHINNPKLFFYIIQRNNEFENLLKFYPKKYYIFSRNNQEIRNLYCDLVSILTLSKKNNLFLDKFLPKINIDKITKNELKLRILNENYNIIQDLGFEHLNNTEILCINQIFHNLNNHQGTLKNCFYWYLLLEKSSKNKNKQKKNNKNNQKYNFDNDVNDYILKNCLNKNSILNYIDSNNLNNFKKEEHWTFILWKMLEKILMNDSKNNIFIQKLKNYYYNIFKENNISNLKYVFFIVFYIIKQNINWNIPLINNYNIYIQCCANINKLYQKTTNNIILKLDKNDQHNYIKKYYEIKNKLISFKENNLQKKYEENNNINLNKIIIGNPLNQKYNKDDLNYSKELINKNKTKKDIIDAKQEKINKKLDFFNNIITKKILKKKIFNNNNDNNEIKELFIFKKLKNNKIN